MGSLLSALLNSSEALQVYDREFATIQNNVTNASTPGFARQQQSLIARSFNLDTGFTGGVQAGMVESARSDYAEEGVRRQQSLLGEAGQKSADLAQLLSLFDLTSNSGVSGTLSHFFQSFSQLAVNPNESNARQSVIDRASDIATSINHTALGLTQASQETDKQIRSTVDTINRLVGQVRDINATRRANAASKTDSGLDAQTYSTFEELSSYANFTVLQQQDGTYSVFLGGQTPMLIGTNQYKVQADFSSPQTAILDANGEGVTAQITTGQLGGLLQEKNVLLPGYLADLNTFARTLADSVNSKLLSGVDSSGASPTVDLFSYNSTLGEAATFSVTGIQPNQIAAALPGAPGGNGNALAVAGMIDQKVLNGFTLTEAFGNIGGKVGHDLSTALEQKQTQTSMATQAKSLRDQISAVDLNTEAAKLLQVQQAYQANSKILTVLSDLTTTIMGLIR